MCLRKVLKNNIKRSLAVGYLAFAFSFLTGARAYSQQPLGATILSNNGGVTFRVWAPNATNVSVRGEFLPSWTDEVPMTNSGGIWTATVINARTNQEYKYFLRPSPRPFPEEGWQNDPRAFWIRNGNSVIYDQSAFIWGSNKTSPVIPVNQMVMYEMHVGTFYDPNPNDSKPGTFDDAIQRLPYLQRLGINVIALMPVSEFSSTVSWGYNPQYPFAIEDSYGGPDALKRFVKEAHRLGIKVQLDVVHNHYASAGETPELMNFGGTNVYFYDTNTPIGRTKWGARPNYANNQVRAFIRDNIQMFLDQYGVDGFRWDSPGNFLGYDNTSTKLSDVQDPQTVNEDGKSLMIEINQMLHTNAVYSGKWSISEDANLLVLTNVETGNSFFNGLRVANSNQSFDGHWQTSFHNDITPEIAKTNPIVGAIQTKVAYWSEPPGERVIFTDNHDKSGNLNGEARLANRMMPSDPPGKIARKKTLLNAALTLTAPGIPMLWMGQEFHATGSFDDSVRMGWGEASVQHRIFRAHRDLIGLRETLSALQNTSLDSANGFVNEDEDLMAYWRLGATNQDHLVVLFNFSAKDITVECPFPATGAWFVQFNSDWGVYGSDFGNLGPVNNTVTANFVNNGSSVRANVPVAAYSVLLLARSSAPSARLIPDANSNGLADGWEAMFGLASSSTDDDQDGLTNLWESQNGLDPLEKDTATVVLDGITNSLRAESNNPNVQFIFWATSAVATPRFPTFRFLSNSITGANFTNPAGGYVRLSFNLTNSNSTGLFFTPNTNLSVADSNRTNWAKFYGITNLNDNPDNDAFTNMQEFSRGSDPYGSNRAAIYLAGDRYNSFDPAANPMNYVGGNIWIVDLPRVGGVPGLFKFTIGSWLSENWGDNLPADGTGDPGGTNIVVNFNNGNGIYRFRFNEANYTYQMAAYDSTDANSDGIQDAWAGYYGLTGGAVAASADPDLDGWSNLAEFKRFTNANGTFMNPTVSDSTTTPKRMTVTGSMPPLPFWQPNANNMTWSDQRMQWEWAGTFASSTSLQFKFSQATVTNWSGGDSWGWNSGASNAGTAIRSGSNDMSANLTGGIRYRFGFNDLTGIYTISPYPVSSEWWESNNLPINGLWSDDTDGDGNSQLMEYALGGNPNSAETNRLISSWMTNQTGTNRLVLRWNERTNFATVQPQWQTNLASTSWTTLTPSNVGGVSGGMQTKEASVPIDSTNRKFLRLKVTGP